MHFYTSINNNYLPKARILAKSIKEYCKEAKFSLILADKIPQGVTVETEVFDEIITLPELGIPVENINLWAFQHTVVELCTAIKGQALVRFLEEGSKKVVYLDPDIAVFDDLHELEELLDIHDIILTPHQTIPENNNRDIENNEICSLKHGTYNFGFYAVKNSERGMTFAKWWRDRLIDYCFDDIPNGLFTDQKWGDLAPALFEGVYISKDPGYNVSTWNLSNREVTKNKEGKYLVNNVPLKFYHFSGFDSGAQEVMLNEYGRNNRNLYDLREWYIKRQEQEEQGKYGTLPSIYNFFDNGDKIQKEERALLKSRLDVYNFFKDTDPYIVEQERSYHKWYLAELAQQIPKVRDNDLHFYTSINNNYLAKARVLAKSVKQYCPNAKFSLILSDRINEDLNIEVEPFDEIILVTDLGIPVENLDFWIYTHTPVELCTAVKGQALVKFLEEGSKKVVYLDPDTVIFDDLHELNNLLETWDMILTPHQTLPETCKEDIISNEICSLQHGVYNFGFYAVKNNENGLRIAKWWRDRLIDFCFDDIPNGIFTDQKWGDLIPALFENIYILRDPGYNVSTWNLTNREVTRDKEGKYFVNGSNLKFYHFSGFDSGAQEAMLNKYANGNVYLYDLRNWYIKMQDEAEQTKCSKMLCTYNFYSNGEKIENEHRKLLRKRVDLTEYFSNINPYIVEQEKSYYNWYFSSENNYGKNSVISYEERVDQLTAQLNCIYKSRSWRLVNYIKKIKNVFRR